ncbi:hypothetical protein M422DRAFT_239387 [Sphaerobolus stellatus SS14]|nr:hypothetical protein M422DRAFT_239387 [Sphaerobolus stellatus SS14]
MPTDRYTSSQSPNESRRPSQSATTGQYPEQAYANSPMYGTGAHNAQHGGSTYPAVMAPNPHNATHHFQAVSILPPVIPGENTPDGLKKRSLTRDPSRRCVCEVCGSRFERNIDLETHMRSHTGERPFVCRVPGCGKAFTVKSNMLRHERTHNADSQFIPANEAETSSSYFHRNSKQPSFSTQRK